MAQQQDQQLIQQWIKVEILVCGTGLFPVSSVCDINLCGKISSNQFWWFF